MGRVCGRRLRAAVVGSIALLACSPAPQVDRHLVLITADTWRADHVGRERVGQPLTPRLDALAARALRFEDASSVGTETSPGVAGLLTGLLPHRSGVTWNVHILPAPVTTLAERLHEAGFATAGWVANPVVQGRWGFGQGFDHFELVRRRPPAAKARAEDLVTRALAWLDERSPAASQRLFLWLHFMEPHGPYVPPAESRSLFPVEAFGAPAPIPLLPAGDNSGLGGIPHYQWRVFEPPPVDGRDYLSRYAAEVRAFDDQVGRFLEQLEARGILAEAAVVFSSDHGEALAGDHGHFFSHANGLTEDQVRVPLWLLCRRCGPGRAESRPVSTLDLVPTALEMLGLGQSQGLDGTSLLDPGPRPVVSETLHTVSLRQGSLKLVWDKRRDRAVALYDLARDPGERLDRLEEERDRATAMAEQLSALRARPAVAPSISRADLDAERRRELEALGYLLPGASP